MKLIKENRMLGSSVRGFWWSALFIALALSMIETVWADAARCVDPPKGAEPVRLLVVTGGHPYEPSEFFHAFEAMPNISYEHVYLIEGKPAAVPIGGIKQYDVVLFYDMEANAITPEWRDLLGRGRGIVFLHHAIGSFPQSSEYRTFAGGHGNFFPEHWPGVPNSIPYINERQHFSIVDRNHPVTCGMQDFDMVDEAYDDVDVDSAVHPLLKSDFPKKTPIVAWTWSYQDKRVFYLQPGHGSLGMPEDHGPTAYQNASFRRLLNRGVLWAAGRL